MQGELITFESLPCHSLRGEERGEREKRGQRERERRDGRGEEWNEENRREGRKVGRNLVFLAEGKEVEMGEVRRKERK